jgi:hypothetical protein
MLTWQSSRSAVTQSAVLCFSSAWGRERTVHGVQLSSLLEIGNAFPENSVIVIS